MLLPQILELMLEERMMDVILVMDCNSHRPVSPVNAERRTQNAE